MNESKLNNLLIIGIILLLLITYIFIMRTYLGSSVDIETHILGAINA